jgi:L-lysine exporter family protein LysE/ArgO
VHGLSSVEHVPPVLLAAVSGLALGLSLIVAIGAQNAYMLRQGLRGDRVWVAIAIFVVSDLLLIAAGVAGAGAVFDRYPQVAVIARIAGAVFLAGYAVLAGRRALRPAVLSVDSSDATRSTTTAVILTALALTWLNPHVYLDTVVLLGSVAQGQSGGRWPFAGGAAVASVAWFIGLGKGAALLRPLFARPLSWRILDGIIAGVMAALAVTLVAGV